MTYYEIFRSCFAHYDTCEEVFSRLLRADSCDIVRTEHGFAAVRDNKIELICVLPQFQRSGEGRALLSLCESRIKEKGFDRVAVGGGLIFGAEESSSEFWGRCGYEVGEQSYADMVLELDGFSVPSVAFPDDVSFGFFSGDIGELHRAVAAVEQDWVQYFTQGGLFCCAFVSGEIASFCIVDERIDSLLCDGNAAVGSVGCVGTVPKFRCRGLGLHTVAQASEWLRDNGCDRVSINYTALWDWYGRLSARPFRFFRFAEKKL